MARKVAHRREAGAGTIVWQLHRMVTLGPGDLDIAYAMSAHGYDAVKWAEGQGVLAELINEGPGRDTSLDVAIQWYDEAARTARRALGTRPGLLTKLGVAASAIE